MSALLCLVAGALFSYVLVYYSVFRGARCSSSVKLNGKTAIVTGTKSERLTPSDAICDKLSGSLPVTETRERCLNPVSIGANVTNGSTD